MTISIETEKAFEKIQHPFMIKSLYRLVIEGNFLNLMNSIYEKPIPNNILDERLKAFSQDYGQGFPHFCSTLKLTSAIRTGKKER